MIIIIPDWSRHIVFEPLIPTYMYIKLEFATLKLSVAWTALLYREFMQYCNFNALSNDTLRLAISILISRQWA